MVHDSHNKHNQGNLSDYIFSIAEQFPDNYAVLHPKKITFKQLQIEIDLMVKGFTRLGIKKGHQIILLIKPGSQLFISVFAILRMGAIPVMIDPGMGAKAMSKALLKLKIDVFIGDPKAHLLRLFYPKTFKDVYCSISTGNIPFLFTRNIYSICSGEWEPSYAVKTMPTDRAAVFFTSGSTGPAKAVLYRNSMLHAQINILHDHFGYSKDEIDCCTFPLTGLLVMCLGLSIVFADMNMLKPATLNPEKLIRNIQQHNCTHLFCSPMVLKRLSEYGTKNNISLPSLRRIMTAGAIVPGNLLSDFKQMLVDSAQIHTPYGATEALPITDIADKELCSLYSSSDSINKAICIGYPLSGIEMKIIEINDDEIAEMANIVELSEDEVGEIIVRGPVVTQEYLGIENQHYCKIWDKKNVIYWHRMGDLGAKDDNGRYWFMGRKSQRVVTKDGVLFTTVIESIFNKHPKVERSALIGIEQKGEEFKKPSICIQLINKIHAKEKEKITIELTELSKKNGVQVDTFFYFNKFPVDPRHNAKIYREKLTTWAQK